MSEDLSAEINRNVKEGSDNPAVKSAIKLIESQTTTRKEKEAEWDAIQEMFENGFSVSDPQGTRRIESQLLFQAIYKTVSKMKPLDVTINGTNKNEDVEKIVTDGVGTVIKKGGFVRALRDKFGAFYRLLTYGDAFIRVGADTDSDFPIRFQNTSLANIYVDQYATSIRNPAGENDVDEIVAIYKYSWDEAIELYPKLKKIGGVGTIMRDVEDQQEYTDDQEREQAEREVEIAHYYNKSKKRYTIFAGSAHTVLEDLKGDEYPFIKDGEPYVPFIHLMCFPSSEGFYNHGIGHYIYRLAVLTRQLDNKAINYGIDNVDPIRMVSLPAGKKNDFFNKLIMAEETRADGRKAFVVNEYSTTDPRGGQVGVETFRSEPITNEWERLFTRLEKQILRIGINLDEVEINPSARATERIAAEEAANKAVRQIMEQNASEFEFVWELAIDFLKKFITKKNKTIINMTTTIKSTDEFGQPTGGEVRVDGITLGNIKEQLSDGNWFVTSNARSGIYPSNTMQQAQIERMLAFTQPGTPAYTRLAVKLARLNDQDISSQDLGLQTQEAEAEGAIPTDTEGLAVQKGGQLKPAL